MHRYMLSIANDGDLYGSIVTVDALSECDAYDAVVHDRGGEGEVVILGTCDDIAKLATERGLERSADYVVKG